ncbi:MAG: TonB-dependent receptor plug domain-containing protein [Gemmatimonadaceae bacterium]
MRAIGLGLLAGAVLHDGLAAQVIPRDSLKRDSVRAVADSSGRAAVGAQRDSTSADSSRADSVKAPLPRAELPIGIEASGAYHFDRAALFSTGALTLAELLDRLPGVTTFRSGLLGSPTHAAFLGDLSRVRVFYDGVEVDALDPRTGGVLDLGEVQLWTLEDVSIERGADEVRVHLRSWRVQRTAIDTRTDVATGDDDTNLYRGFFGRRFRHGEALQLAAQQYGYSGRDGFLGGGDQLALLARAGWSRGRIGFDAFALRGRRTRDPQGQLFGSGSIPSLRGTRTDAYVRASYGDPADGSWLQAIAASLAFDETSTHAVGDTVDTLRSVAQYVVAGGVTRGPLRLSATGRARVGSGVTRSSVAGRAAYSRGPLALALYAEESSGDSASVEEAVVRLAPLPWLALTGALGRRHGGAGGAGGDARLAGRAEGAVRLGRLWAGGGLIFRDSTALLPGALVYDPTYEASGESDRATAVFGTARGLVFKAIGVDAFVARWSSVGAYRPQLQARGDLYLITNWKGRFPRGNFGFHGSIGYEYRTEALFPRSDGSADISSKYRGLNSLLEIRILDGAIFWQQRYRILPSRPEIVPGFGLPRQSSIYGVRWQFWN